MKKQLLLILAFMLIPIVSNAQVTGQRTESYPAVVNGHLAFMGIPINTPEESFRKQLLTKGFKVYVNKYGQKFPEILVGVYKGRKVQFGTGYKMVFIQDDKRPTLANAKKRYKELVAELESIYGKGVANNTNDVTLRHEIKTPQGNVIVEMYNEDEMEGDSDYYIVGFVLSESEYD
jgi:hypothetical protein